MKKSARTPFNAKSKHTAYSQRLALESRLVFDGAAVATVDAVQPDTVDANPVADNSPVDLTLASEPNAVAPDQATIAVDFQPNADTNQSTYDPAPTPLDTQPVAISPIMDVQGDNTATSVIVVDPRADNAAALLANPPANTHILTLDTTRDGFQQIADYLQTRHDVTQLDVLTWSDGNHQQWLGNKALTGTIETSVSHELALWGDGLTDKANIVFHGADKLSAGWLTYIDALTGGTSSWSQDDGALIASVPQRTEIVFIENSIDDYQMLLDGISAGSEIHILDSSQDGLSQIARILQGRSGIDAVHIISHGSEGAVSLGTLDLTATNLTAHSADLSIIGTALNTNADILLYGCNVGRGTAGVAFLAGLAELTGADVAASDDKTGAIAAGGDAILEMNVGTVETAFVINSQALANYGRVLPQSFVSATPPNIDSGATAGNALWVVGDFNNDGAVDVLTQAAASGAVTLWTNNGSGTFTGTAAIAATTNLILTGAKVADYNNDGNQDLYVSVNSATDLYYTGNGAGGLTFATPPNIDSGATAGNALWVVGDFNNDGAVDALTQAAASGAVTLWTNNGSGTFTSTTAIAATTNLILTGAKVADYNNDGNQDLYVSVNSAADLYYTGNGAGGLTFAAPPNIDSGATAGNALWVVGDFNNDGAVDALTQAVSGGDVTLWTNNGSGTFTSTTAITATAGLILTGAKVADYNGDGDQDLYVSVNSGTDLYYDNVSASPTLTSFTPTSNATGVGTSDNLVLTFTHATALSKGTGTITIKVDNGDGNYGNDTTFETFAATDARVTLTGNATSSTVTINPTGTFAGNINYYVVIDPTAFIDTDNRGFVTKVGSYFHTGIPDPAKVQAGNSLDTVSDKTVFSFITTAASNTAPTFIGATTTLNINENAAATDIKALLHISDTDASQTETWTQSVAPTHGTLSFTSATASSGSADIITAGTITYTPTAGYAGTDTFTIQVSDGNGGTVTRVINVNVTPLTPSVPDLVALTDTGSSNTDNRTNAALLNFTGTSAAGDSTSKAWVFIDTNANGIYDGGTDPVASTVLSNGSWTLNGLSTAAVADGTYNLYAFTTTSANALPSALSSPISITIDRTAPSITNVSIPNVSMKVGDTVTATLTVANDGGDIYTLGSSTIDGFTVSNLIRTNATTYTAQFTVTEGGTDIAAASAIPLSLILTDTAGNSNTAYTTAISQAADAINAHTPTSMALSATTISTSAANNAVVGALSSTDATSGDTFTYTLVAGAGSTDNASFNISGGNLQATTPSGLTAGVKSVRVRTTDAGGNFYEQTFSITVSAPANTAPTFTGGANTGLTVLEDAAITTITTAMLNVTDAEQAASALTYTITTASTKGVLSKSGVALGVGGTFTQADINSGIIKYTPNFNANGADSVGFSVSDGAGGTLSGQTFNFTITPVSDVNIVAGITPVEGATGTFTITLDSAPAADLVINYTLDSASTATLTTDYTVSAGAGIGAVTAGTFTILAGQTTATLNINALTDVIVDPNETVILKLAAGSGYQLAATSTSSFTAKVDYATGTGSNSVITGDFNGDGKLDMAVANYNANTVSVLLRNAANTGFDAKVDYVTGTNPYSVTTGDFNGDGKLDMAVANRGSDTVSVLLRNAANTGFDAKVDYATGAVPVSVTTGDFNGDGKLDMALANYNANTVSVLLRNAANTGFDAKVDYATGTGSSSVTTGDFNGDGKLDMAVTSQISNTVSVLLRNAANTGFDAKVDYGTGTGSVSVTTGDFNGDGKLDMAVANFNANTVSVLLRNAANTGFDAKVDYATGTGSQSVTTGDFNGDGKLDMAVANYSANTVSVLLRNAANTGFDAKVDYATGTNPYSVTTGDFNGDGKLDMAVANFASNTVSVLLNNTAPSATLTITDVNTPPVSSANTGLTVLEDAAITTITNTMLSVTDAEQAASALTYTITTASTKGVLSKSGVALGVGGTFTQADINSGIIKYTPNFNANGADSVGFSVSDGAGGTLSGQTFNFTITPVSDVNIVAGITPVEGATGTFTITLDSAPAANLTINYTLDSASTATLTTDYTVSAGAGISAVTAGTITILAGQTTATLNINALTDAVTDLNETVILKLAAGSGYQLSSSATASFSTGSYAAVNPGMLVSADFNNDGILDIAAANQFNNLSVNLGNGSGGFGAAINTAIGAGTRGVISADLNGDGKVDLVTADYNTGNMTVLLGNGNGTFSASMLVGNNFGGSYSVTSGDFNGDGKLDLALAESFNNNVFIYLGNGSGSFSVPTSLAITNPVSIITRDFNGDGKLDLVTANNSNGVAINLGNGNGTFAAATNIVLGAGTNPSAVISGDFNSDGKLDLATANSGASNVSILLGNGTGGFAAATNFAVSSNPASVVSGDFNGDRILDLATANTSGNTVSVILGNGSGGFGTATNLATAVGASPMQVISADFNGDGKADLATANYNGNTVNVFLNTAVPKATLTITDVLPNTAPTLGGTFTTAGTVNDNATTTPFSNVTVNDAESNNVSITITYAAANGTLAGAGLTGSAGNYTLTSASLAAVQSNLRALVFTPTANQVAVGSTVQTTFTLTPNDGTVNGTANATTLITATSINDAPTSATLNTPETYTEDTALNLTDIVISDVDVVASNVYTATLTLSNIAAGSLSTATSGAVTSTYNAGTGVWSASGSKADVNALLAGVTFNPALNFNSNFNIATSISDGIAAAVTGTKAFTGVAVNDAPTLDNTQSPTLTAINEDVLDASNTGNTVASIVVTASIIDVDTPAPKAIAVSAVDNTNGVWQYKIGAGAWIAFDFTTNSGKALLLDSADSIRFVPNANWNGTVSNGITFYAWDKTSGTAGNYLTVSGNTGATATLSTATDTASLVVNAVNDVPTFTGGANTGLTVLEDAAITTITTAMLNVTDVEQAAAALTYTITTASTKGVLSKSGAALGVGGTFTQADINSGIIKYTPNLNANGSDSVGFSVSDGAGGTLSAQTFTIGITAVNDAPILGTLFVENFDTLGLTGNSNVQYLTGLTTHYNSLLTGWQAAGNSTFHGVEVQTGNWAFMIYADNVGTQIATVAANTSGTTYTVNFDIAPSVHFIAGQASDANDKVDIKVYDASNNLLADYQAGGGVMTANPLFIHKSFTYTGNGNGNIHFVIGSAFPGNNHFAGTIDNLSISSQSLTAISEDVLDASNTGNTVASIVVNGSITDVDYSPITSAPESIAVSAVDNTNGVWQYKIGAGAWTAFDFTTNSGKALLLDSADSIRFVPNANWNGTVSNGITFYAWDKTSGTAGNYLTVSGNTGGTATLSTATDSASIVVTAVNDAPVASGSATLAAVLEDISTAATGATISSLFAGNFSDVADTVAGGSSANTFAGIAISNYTVDAAKGAWQYKIGAGAWTALSSATTTAAITLASADSLRFVPAADYNGAATALSANLIESGVAITSGGVINLTSTGTGGITSYSSATVALNHTITAVNDAPTGVGNLTLAAVNENTVSPAGAAINTLTGFSFTDIDTGATLKGVAVVGSGDGNWQYSTNGGTNWYSIGTVGIANTLILAPTTLVRYLPVANYAGTPLSLQLKALDDTYAGGFSTTAGAETRVTLDTTVNGGTTAIAANTNTLSTSVTDVNPVISNASVSLNENSVAGTAVTTVTATNDTNGLIYSITGGNLDVDMDGNLAFSINASTGAITVNDAGDLNFETTPSFSLAVAVDDEDPDTIADSTATITVNLQNLDEVAPTITSSATATAINENSGAGQVIYTVTSTDITDYVSGATAYSLTGTDAGLFTINSATGAVTLTANPNFEAKASYSFNVVATDAANNASSKAVTLAINNLDEVAPTITSSAIATAIDENSGAAQVIYTVTSTDVTDYVSGATAYSLSGTDAGLFTINSTSGAVTLTANPNFETKASYSFNVIATDAATNASTKAVTLAINDLNEAPSVTSGGTLSVAENSTGTVYTATGADPDTAQTLSWSIGGTDAALFSINSTSGALTFNTVPNFELPADNGGDNVYDLTVIATDNGTGNLTASKALTITVTNVNEAPTTSAPASISVVEDVASALTGISFADVDAGGAAVTATLAVNSGTLSAISGGGVTVTGSGTASMSLAGTLANINAFIASSAVSFTTAANSISNVTLSSSLNDNGNSGSGGALSSALSTTTLTVTGIADTPSVGSPTINEDIDSGAIAITRNAADGAEVTHYKITGITGGTLYSDAGFTTAITAGSFIASSGATTNVYFRPTANSNTAGSFIVQASTSNADAGLGGATATSTINITPIADTASVTSSSTTPAIQTTSGLVISRNAVDGAEVTNFKITNIINGTLYQNDGTTQITAGSFITYAQANAGLKFTPSGISNGSFDVQASTSNVDAGLGGAVSTATISLGIAIANANTNEDTGTGAIAITGNTGFYKITGLTGGTLYSDAGFTTPIANGGFISTSGAITNVYFRPAADFNGTAGFTVQGSSSNSDAGLGGNTATSTITVNPVNDAPTGSGNLTLPAVDEDTVSPAGAAINTLAGLNFTDVDAGASLSGIVVIANTANANTQGVWQYSTNGGTNWYNIGTVTGNSAVALSATSLVRFVPVLDFNGTPPSLTVRALDNTYAEGFTNGAVLVTTNAAINGGSSGISANTNTIDTRIAAVNDAPAWSGLANTVSFTEDSAAVVLANAITLSDVDLNALSYADATLTLVRNGNANADDVFANTGTLGALTQGGNLTVNGVVIGTVTSNSAGLLTLTFNANATKALVNSALQQITYSNSSNTPPASVQIMWLFNDNNTGAQGKGAAFSALRTTTVTITPTNDAPIAVNDTATLVNGGTLSGRSLLANDSDPDNDVLTVNTTPITNVAHGTLTLYANGSYLYQHDGSAAKTDSFVYEISDGHGGKAQATVTMTISGSPQVNQPTGNVVFLNNLSIFFDNFLTSGSLILLSNCDHYVESHSRYVFDDKNQQPDHQYHGDYALPPVHLSLYVPLRYHIISVAGVLPQQTLIAQEFYVFKIPNWLFQHRNPYETLKFTATHLDGKPLPEWIKLNPKTLTFFGLAPKGAQDVRVMMTIGDQYGNKVHAVFTIHVTEKVPAKNVVGEQRRAVGKSGFSEQLYSAGKVSKLQESRRLLDSLNHL